MKTLLEEVKAKCDNHDNDSLIVLVIGEGEKEDQYYCEIGDVFNKQHLGECRVIKIDGCKFYLNSVDFYTLFTGWLNKLEMLDILNKHNNERK